MIDCPKCGTLAVDGLECHACGFHEGTHTPESPVVAAARAHYLATAPKPERSMTRDEARATLRKFGRTPGGNPRAWVKRILERIESGDRLPALSQQYAREVAESMKPVNLDPEE